MGDRGGSRGEEARTLPSHGDRGGWWTDLAEAGTVMFHGARDALRFDALLFFFYSSGTLRKRTVQSLLLNGCIFLGSMLVFDFVIAPSRTLFLPAGGESGLAAWLETLLELVYNVLWLYPIYSISFVLNTIWYNDIAMHAYKAKFGAKSRAVTYRKWLRLMADEIYRLLLFGTFMLEISVLFAIPYIGALLAFVHMTWLYAYWCFDYRWALQGASLERSMVFFEQRFLYFAGFGAPCTIATFFFPTFVRSGVFALLFPLFVIMATIAKPRVHATHRVPRTLALFAVCRVVNSRVLHAINRRRTAVQGTGGG